jgi:hypothetical protein
MYRPPRDTVTSNVISSLHFLNVCIDIVILITIAMPKADIVPLLNVISARRVDGFRPLYTTTLSSLEFQGVEEHCFLKDGLL